MSTLNQITILLISSVFVGSILRFLKQPLFLAYILVGLFFGNYFLPTFELNLGNQYFEIIVSLLLFITGLSINLKHVKDLGENAVFKGIMAFLLISIIFYFLLSFLGFDVFESIILSLCFTLSSKVILNKISSDDFLHRNFFNKLAQSHLLVQLFFLIFILVFLSSTSQVGIESLYTEQVLNNFLKALVLIINLFLISKYIFPRLDKIISSNNELLILFVLGFGFGVISLFRFLNLSYELGALIAGVLLSIHSFSIEALSKLRVLREVSLLGFFVILGAGLQLDVLSEKFLLIIVLILLILLVKILSYLFVEKLNNTPLRDNFFSTLSLTSISEFSIIVILLANASGLINYEIFSVVGFIYVFLAIINIYLITHRDFLFEKYFYSLKFFKNTKVVPESIKDTDVILLGCGKMGFEFLNTYKYLKSKLLVVDYDLEVQKKISKMKLNFVNGDLNDEQFFDSLPFINAKLIYMSIVEVNLIKDFLTKLKSRKYQGVKVVVSYNHADTLEFYRLGADYVVMPDYIPGKFVSDLTLNLGFEPKKYLSEKSIHLDSLKVIESKEF
jgi:Kef-type K+ transport system membrane component KefB